MKLKRLDHITINTSDLQASLEFYDVFLNLQPGFRPNFSMDGAWLYAPGSDAPIVHLICQDQTSPGSGGLDHIAFNAEGIESFYKRVSEKECDYVARPVHELDMIQVLQSDPSGVVVEVNFYGEAAPEGMVMSEQF